MEPTVETYEDRQNIDRLKHLLPLYEKHAFWDTQPVPKNMSATIMEDKEGEFEHIQAKDIPKEAYTLPAGFEWDTLDINDDKQAKELYELLKGNYVEDSESTFRFDYSIEFLRWALTVPGYNVDWHLCVRASSNKKLLAFISGTPSKVVVNA